MASWRSSSRRGPVHGSGVTVAFHGGWLVEPEAVLAKPEWFKRLTCPVRGPQKRSQLCSCLIWGSQKTVFKVEDLICIFFGRAKNL